MDDAAYLAAIVAAPDDDDLRLVWADALQARGEPRGELIALQVAAARRRAADAAGPTARDEADALERLADDLLGDHEDAWTPPAIGDLPLDQVTFRRGFVEAVKLDAAALVACADELFATTPVLELHVTGLDLESARRLADLPHLARVRALTLATHRPAELDGPTAVVLASPHLTGLRSLTVRGGGVETTRALLASATLPALEHLAVPMPADAHIRLLASGAAPALARIVMNNVQVDEALVRALTAPHRRAHLTSLRLRSCAVGGDLLAELIASDLPALRELDLYGNRIGHIGYRALADAELPALRELALQITEPRPADLAALLTSPRRAGLEALDLRTNQLGAAAAVLGALALPALRRLDLTDNNLDPATVVALATHAVAPLEHLALSNNGVGDDGARALATRRATLRRLDLDDAGLTAAGLGALAEAVALPALRALRAEGATVDDRAAAALSAAVGLPALRTLGLGSLRRGAAWATTIVGSPLMARLENLELGNTHLAEDFLHVLAANPDATALRELHLNPIRGVTTDGLLAVARSPHLRLRVLEHRFDLRSDRDVRALVEAPGLRQIRHLLLSASKQFEPALRARFGRRVSFLR